MTPGTDLPYNVDFRITFPNLYDLSDTLSTACSAVPNASGVTLAGSFFCSLTATATNVLTIKGNSAAIVKGNNEISYIQTLDNLSPYISFSLTGTQITVSLSNIYNPNYSLITDLFEYQIM